MRARKSAQTAFSSLKVNDADKSSSSVVQAVSAMLNYRGNGLSVKELIDNGGTPKSAIENTLKDSVVLDISGCTVEEILFLCQQGQPGICNDRNRQCRISDGIYLWKHLLL